MKLEKMLLEIEQTAKYGTPLLTTDAVCILAKLRAAEELADAVNAALQKFPQIKFDLCREYIDYRDAGDGE